MRGQQRAACAALYRPDVPPLPLPPKPTPCPHTAAAAAAAAEREPGLALALGHHCELRWWRRQWLVLVRLAVLVRRCVLQASSRARTQPQAAAGDVSQRAVGAGARRRDAAGLRARTPAAELSLACSHKRQTIAKQLSGTPSLPCFARSVVSPPTVHTNDCRCCCRRRCAYATHLDGPRAYVPLRGLLPRCAGHTHDVAPQAAACGRRSCCGPLLRG
jgi:hypothetical protein